MNRKEFWESLSEDGRRFFKELAEAFGPLQFEGEEAPEGVIIKPVTSYQPYRAYWVNETR